MAEVDQKYEDNVPGVFYVDNTCIDCDACREAAPDNFNRNDDGGYSFLDKQPESEDEYQLCLDALDSCPVEAIGENGDE